MRDPKDFINVISLNYSDNNKNCEDDNDVVSMNALNLSVNEFDVHSDPSQNHNKFQCTECDYQCKYPDIFNEHMKADTGEN